MDAVDISINNTNEHLLKFLFHNEELNLNSETKRTVDRSYYNMINFAFVYEELIVFRKTKKSFIYICTFVFIFEIKKKTFKEL